MPKQEPTTHPPTTASPIKEQIKAVFPSFDEWARGKGKAMDAALAELAKRAKFFPDGLIPEAVIRNWITDHFDQATVMQYLMDAAAAWAHLQATGKGPVAPPAGAELA